jgi:hypothetical protein
MRFAFARHRGPPLWTNPNELVVTFSLGSGLSSAIASNSNAGDGVTAEPSVFFVDH